MSLWHPLPLTPTCGKSGVLALEQLPESPFGLSHHQCFPFLDRGKKAFFVWACDRLTRLGRSAGFGTPVGVSPAECSSPDFDFSLSEWGCNSPWHCWPSAPRWNGPSLTRSDSPWPLWHCFHRFAMKQFYILQNRVIDLRVKGRFQKWCFFFFLMITHCKESKKGLFSILYHLSSQGEFYSSVPCPWDFGFSIIRGCLIVRKEHKAFLSLSLSPLNSWPCWFSPCYRLSSPLLWCLALPPPGIFLWLHWFSMLPHFPSSPDTYCLHPLVPI